MALSQAVMENAGRTPQVEFETIRYGILRAIESALRLADSLGGQLAARQTSEVCFVRPH
jgi:hypothetical protein